MLSDCCDASTALLGLITVRAVRAGRTRNCSALPCALNTTHRSRDPPRASTRAGTAPDAGPRAEVSPHVLKTRSGSDAPLRARPAPAHASEMLQPPTLSRCPADSFSWHEDKHKSALPISCRPPRPLPSPQEPPTPSVRDVPPPYPSGRSNVPSPYLLAETRWTPRAADSKPPPLSPQPPPFAGMFVRYLPSSECTNPAAVTLCSIDARMQCSTSLFNQLSRTIYELLCLTASGLLPFRD